MRQDLASDLPNRILGKIVMPARSVLGHGWEELSLLRTRHLCWTKALCNKFIKLVSYGLKQLNFGKGSKMLLSLRQILMQTIFAPKKI